MDKVNEPLMYSDLLYDMAVIADTVQSTTVTDTEAYHLLHNFIKAHHKNKHPMTQFAVRAVQHVINTVETKKAMGSIVINREPLRLIKY